jgi:hypothetical protein
MVAYRRISDEEISCIRIMRATGAPNSIIARELRRDQSTVAYWAVDRRRGLRNPTPKTPKRVVKAVKARREIVKKLVCQVVKVKHRVRPAYSSARALNTALRRDYAGTFAGVTTQTIRNDLRALGFNFRSRPRSAPYGDDDYKVRLAFTRRYIHVNPKRLVFTDEKTFTCGDYSRRGQWTGPGMSLLPRDGSTAVQDTVYVWAAIGFNFRKIVILRATTQAERVARCTGREKTSKKCFDSDVYIRRCLQGELVDNCTRNHLILQADNHRVHYSAKVKAYLAKKGVESTKWPARSPDLNPIENFWAYLQERVSLHVPMNAAELAFAIKAEFELTPQAVVDKFVLSFGHKCERVYRAKGKLAG